jgi:hypothetical protein
VIQGLRETLGLLELEKLVPQVLLDQPEPEKLVPLEQLVLLELELREQLEQLDPLGLEKPEPRVLLDLPELEKLVLPEHKAPQEPLDRIH